MPTTATAFQNYYQMDTGHDVWAYGEASERTTGLSSSGRKSEGMAEEMEMLNVAPLCLSRWVLKDWRAKLGVRGRKRSLHSCTYHTYLFFVFRKTYLAKVALLLIMGEGES